MDEDKNNLEEDIKPYEVDKAIHQLRAATSVGTTDIPPELIKNLDCRGRTAIWKWANKVWHDCDPPHQNDVLRTTFLHKKGVTDTLDNYRTLTIGCNICKVYNRIITNRIQEVAENSNILGEIQNGFRPGRRATDNLLVLETVIRKTKLENKKNYMALLDITKAYDRVDRHILWTVMEQMGFPKILMDNLRATYRNPTSTVHFQNTQSDPLKLTLGLKQGCVLSPVLFAIYIAELGRRLMDSSLGIKLDDRKIPGMFFADDMMLIGSQRELQKLFDIVGAYAQEFKLEFAGHKSSVIPLGGPIDRTRKWKLGVQYISATENRDIYIEEVNEGRYLGVTIERNYSIFKPQWELALQKARRGAGLVGMLVRRCSNPLTILKPLWQSYILPAVLYGTEIMDTPETHIKSLEVIQNGLMKNVLRVIPGTATAGCHALTGLTSIKQEVWKKKLSYYTHVLQMPEGRWAKKAYREQLQWGIRENIWNIEGNQTENNISSKKKFWLNDITICAKNLKIDLPRGWEKHHVTAFFEWKRRKLLQTEIASHDTLCWLGDISQDHNYDNRTQLWWLKAKIGSIRTKNRIDPLNKCILCGAENETVKHMLHCDRYLGKSIYDTIHIEPTIQHIWRWIFHSDRHNLDRMRISHWIHNRWKIRVQLLSEERIRNTPDTGGQGQQEVVVQGAMDPETQHHVITPHQILPETQMRRGPPRKCKKPREVESQVH